MENNSNQRSVQINIIFGDTPQQAPHVDIRSGDGRSGEIMLNHIYNGLQFWDDDDSSFSEDDDDDDDDYSEDNSDISINSDHVPETGSDGQQESEAIVNYTANKSIDWSSTMPGSNEKTICKICYEVDLNIVFVPCGHAIACEKCIEKCGKKCPVCRLKGKPVKLFIG